MKRLLVLSLALAAFAVLLVPAPVVACPSCNNPELWTAACGKGCSFCAYCSYCCGQQGIGCRYCELAFTSVMGAELPVLSEIFAGDEQPPVAADAEVAALFPNTPPLSSPSCSF